MFLYIFISIFRANLDKSCHPEKLTVIFVMVAVNYILHSL